MASDRRSTDGGLSDLEVTNAAIFISDALRWDHLLDGVRDRGVTYKTVAQSTATNTSVPSILTGRYPPEHRVKDWIHTLPEDVGSVFDRANVDSAYETSNTWWSGASPLFDMFHIGERQGLADLSEPFVYVLHDKGGHAPYEGRSIEDFPDRSSLLSAYHKSVAESARRFYEFLDDLEQQGLRDDTLVAFVSDHGELLGEYGGFYGHGYPICPELVYVPTVFVHPQLEAGVFNDNVLAEQVDLLPSIYHAMDVSHQCSGDSLASVEDKSHGLTFRDHHNANRFIDHGYVGHGYFERTGGYVFHTSNLGKRLVHFASDHVRGPGAGKSWVDIASPAVIRKFRHYVPDMVAYDEPEASVHEARELLDAIPNGLGLEPEHRELDDETKDAMENLGYL